MDFVTEIKAQATSGTRSTQPGSCFGKRYSRRYNPSSHRMVTLQNMQDLKLTALVSCMNVKRIFWPAYHPTCDCILRATFPFLTGRRKKVQILTVFGPTSANQKKIFQIASSYLRRLQVGCQRCTCLVVMGSCGHCSWLAVV